MSYCINCNRKTTGIYQQKLGIYELCHLCWDGGLRLYYSNGLGNPIPYQDKGRNITALGIKQNSPLNSIKWRAWCSNLRHDNELKRLKAKGII